MSNGEVKRWETISIDTKIPGTRFDVDDVPRVTVISADDHERIVAELKAEIAAQKRVIEKLKGMVSHYETCATVDRYDDEKVPCDCGLEKELAAIEKGEE